MARDLPALLGNKRLAPAAALPVAVALGQAAVDRPIAHPIAIALPLLVVTMAIGVGFRRQRRMRKPQKVWRDATATTIAFEIAVIMTSAVSLAFIVAPWH